MLKIIENHSIDPGTNIIEVTLKIENEKNLLNYGIAYAIRPNVYNYIQDVNVNNVQNYRPITEVVFNVNESCTCSYYAFKIGKKFDPVSEIYELPLFVSYDTILDDTFFDDTSSEQNIILNLSDHTNDYVWCINENYYIDMKNFNKIISQDDFNYGDHFYPTKRFIHQKNSTNKILYLYYGLLRYNLYGHLLNNYNIIYKKSNDVNYWGDISTNLPCALPSINISFSNHITFKGYKNLNLSTYDYTANSHGTQCILEIDDIDYNFIIGIQNKHGWTDHIELPAKYRKFTYRIAILCDVVLYISSTDGNLIYSYPKAFYANTTNEFEPASPIIDSTISNGKIKFNVISIADKLVYKLHHDTTTFNGSPEQIEVDLNRNINDINAFIKSTDPVISKCIEIDCTSNVASIEAFVSIGLLTQPESATILTSEMFPNLKEIVDYKTNQYGSGSSDASYLPIYNLSSTSKRFLMGSSDITKQIVTSTGIPKINNYYIIPDEYMRRIEVRSPDTTTFNVKIKPLLSSNSKSISDLFMQEWYNSIDSNVARYKYRADRLQLYSNDDETILSYDDFWTNYNAIDKRIIKDNKMLMVNGMFDSNGWAYCWDTLIPLNYAILQLHTYGAYESKTQYVDELNLYTSYNAIDNLSDFYIFQNYNILISSIDVSFDVYLFLGGSEKMINIADSSDKDLILDSIKITKVGVTLNDDSIIEFNYTDKNLNFSNLNITDMGLSDTGFKSITIEYETDIYFYHSPYTFTDQRLIDNQDLYASISYLFIAPKILLSGGNATLNNISGNGGKMNYTMDHIIANNTTFVNQDVDLDINIDSTNSTIIDVAPYINKHFTTNDFTILAQTLKNRNDSNFLTRSEAKEISVDDIKFSVCDFKTYFIQPAHPTLVHDFEAQYNSSESYKFMLSLPNGTNTYRYKVNNKIPNHKRYPEYKDTYFQGYGGGGSSSTELALCDTYVSSRGNYQNEDTTSLEIDTELIMFTESTYGYPLPKKIINLNDMYFESSNFNKNIATIKNIYHVTYSHEILTDEYPLMPIIIPWRGQYDRYNKWRFGISMRSNGTGIVPPNILNERFTMPKSNDRWSFDIIDDTRNVRLISINKSRPTYDLKFSYHQNTHSQTAPIIKIVAHDYLNEYPDRIFYVHIGDTDWILL